jgi:hypothetical protein
MLDVDVIREIAVTTQDGPCMARMSGDCCARTQSNKREWPIRWSDTSRAT